LARNVPTNPNAAIRRRAYLALAAASFVAGLLYRFPPEQYSFYPRCPVLALTGWQCPGCGMTRALAALLHGHFAEALRWNPLVLLVVAAFLAWVVTACLGRRTAWPKLPDFALVGMLVASAAFMIVRNLP